MKKTEQFDLPNEVFKPVPGLDRTMLSNNGRVKVWRGNFYRYRANHFHWPRINVWGVKNNRYTLTEKDKSVILTQKLIKTLFPEVFV